MLLRIIALIAANLTLIPPVLLCALLLNFNRGDVTIVFLLLLLLSVLTSSAGYFAGHIVNNLSRHNVAKATPLKLAAFTARTIMALFYIFAFFVLFYSFQKKDFILCLLLSLAPAISYLSGYQCCSGGYRGFFSRRRIWISSAFLVISATGAAILSNGDMAVDLMKHNEAVILYRITSVIIALFIFSVFHIKNQENLELNIGGVEDGEISLKARFYNAGIAAFMSTLLVLALNAGTLAGWLVKAAGLAFIYLLKGLIFLLSFLRMSEIEGGDTGSSQLEMPLVEETGTSLVSVILEVIVMILVTLLIVRYSPAIIKRIIKRIIKAINVFFTLILSKLSHINIAEDENPADMEFDDDVQDIPREERLSSPGLKDKGLRIARSLFKAKPTAGASLTARARFLYRQCVEKAIEMGIVIKRSDTSGQIRERINEYQINKYQIENEGAFLYKFVDELTPFYEKTRYGQKIPDETKMKDFEKRWKIGYHGRSD